MEPMKTPSRRRARRSSAQNLRKPYEAAPRDRFFLLFTAAFCVLLVDTFLWYGPTAGMTAAVFVWYLLVFSFLGAAPLTVRSNCVLLLFNLFLALTLALSSSWMFRLWNGLALLVLLPVHALALSGAPQLPGGGRRCCGNVFVCCYGGCSGIWEHPSLLSPPEGPSGAGAIPPPWSWGWLAR